MKLAILKLPLSEHTKKRHSFHSLFLFYIQIILSVYLLPVQHVAAVYISKIENIANTTITIGRFYYLADPQSPEFVSDNDKITEGIRTWIQKINPVTASDRPTDDTPNYFRIIVPSNNLSEKYNPICPIVSKDTKDSTISAYKYWSNLRHIFFPNHIPSHISFPNMNSRPPKLKFFERLELYIRSNMDTLDTYADRQMMWNEETGRFERVVTYNLYRISQSHGHIPCCPSLQLTQNLLNNDNYQLASFLPDDLINISDKTRQNLGVKFQLWLTKNHPRVVAKDNNLHTATAQNDDPHAATAQNDDPHATVAQDDNPHAATAQNDNPHATVAQDDNPHATVAQDDNPHATVAQNDNPHATVAQNDMSSFNPSYIKWTVLPYINPINLASELQLLNTNIRKDRFKEKENENEKKKRGWLAEKIQNEMKLAKNTKTKNTKAKNTKAKDTKAKAQLDNPVYMPHIPRYYHAAEIDAMRILIRRLTARTHFLCIVSNAKEAKKLEDSIQDQIMNVKEICYDPDDIDNKISFVQTIKDEILNKKEMILTLKLANKEKLQQLEKQDDNFPGHVTVSFLILDDDSIKPFDEKPKTTPDHKSNNPH